MDYGWETRLLDDMTGRLMMFLLPMGLLMTLVAVASNIASGGWNMTFKPLQPKFSNLNPLTGFFRNGHCDTCVEDDGCHTVCVEVTAEFLAFSLAAFTASSVNGTWRLLVNDDASGDSGSIQSWTVSLDVLANGLPVAQIEQLREGKIGRAHV